MDKMPNWIKCIIPVQLWARHKTVEYVSAVTTKIQPDLIRESINLKNRGDDLLEQGSHFEAVSCYNQAISKNPYYAEAYANLGNSLREQGLPGDAERAFYSAIQINPDLAYAYYNLASLLRDQGRINEAITCLFKAVDLKPDEGIFYSDLCYALLQTGDSDAARKILSKGIQTNPDYYELHFALGYLHYQQQEYEKAAICYQKVISIRPDDAEAYAHLGKSFRELGNHIQAAYCFQKAIESQPGNATIHFELGCLLQAQMKHDEALVCYQKSLELNPKLVEAYANMGNIYRQLGKIEDCITSYQHSISLKHDFVEAYLVLGKIFNDLRNFDLALTHYQTAILHKPDCAEAYLNAGSIFIQKGKIYEAIDYCRKALSFNANFAEAHFILGTAFNHLGNLNDALSHYNLAISLHPDFIEAYVNLGNIYSKQFNPAEAIACYRTALNYDPNFFTAKMNLLLQCQQICDWSDYYSSVTTIREAVSNFPYSNKNNISPFSLISLPGVTASEQKLCSIKHSQNKDKSTLHGEQSPAWKFTRSHLKNTKINLAYLSADFHDHATARLMVKVFERHDRSRFNITAYSYGPNDKSDMRKRLEKSFDLFIDIRDISHESASRLIVENQTDLLVDLKGCVYGNRSEILALRPAPIQVNYLGYPGTMGAQYVDYLIADQFIVPTEHFENYSESIVWLPHCYQPTDNSRQRPKAPSRKECGLPEKGIVFCCFNQTYKINPGIFDIWCSLLKNVPESVLWLLSSHPDAEHNLRHEAELRGVNPDCLVIAHPLDELQHLARLQCADLFLDTQPCNAHTTCSDALWMGLPVITCVGDTFPSRVAGSLLTAIDVPELITYNIKDYYNLALDLSTNNEKREAIHEKISANRTTTALFNSELFTRNLENAYLKMMQNYAKNNKHD
jgi:predicted O-linked N-acetylglucosamine transferase (SPINDLY family)